MTKCVSLWNNVTLMFGRIFIKNKVTRISGISDVVMKIADLEESIANELKTIIDNDC
ncbi:MAG: hypothetical protein N3I35_15345 [Clostridia bacterium]|nr:hypothetical protein [Clostridia bacterium]